MKKFLVLYHSEAALKGMSARDMFANSTPEQIQAGMGAWMAWQQAAGSSIVDLGAPLDSSTVTTGGPGKSDPSTITGFSLVQAASIEDAVGLMKEHPHLRMPGGSIQLLETVPIPGM